MFILYAEKTRLSVQKSEPVTSGSINVYPVRFQFSPDWDGMVPTAVFRADWKTYSVVLDRSGQCVIPWEALAKPRVKLQAGVYGARGGDVVLPTVWADLGTILEGAGPGEAARPPTAGLYDQVMAQLAEIRERLQALSDLDHRLLSGREDPDQHTIGAVTGLEAALSSIPAPLTPGQLEEILSGTAVTPPGVDSGKLFVSGGGMAALWERTRAALEAKLDRGDEAMATDAEVAEMLEEVLGPQPGQDPPEESGTASAAEVLEMLDEVFGTSRGE